MENDGRRGLAEHEGDDMRGAGEENEECREEGMVNGGGGGGGGGKWSIYNTEANVGIILVNRICSQTGGIVITH